MKLTLPGPLPNKCTVNSLKFFKLLFDCQQTRTTDKFMNIR